MQYVLGMAANAVAPDKKQDFITGCFGPDADIETINATCSKLISNLPAIDLGSNLSIANLAVAPGDVTFPDLDKDVLSDVFKAPFCRISTGSKTAEYTAEINSWASRHTNGKIDKLLEADNSDYGTGVMIMYLNALYFDSKWNVSFSSCGKKPFNTAEGVTNIDMMAATLRSQFYDNGNFKITCIPMGESGKFKMAILIPEGGIGSVDADTIDAALEAAQSSASQLIKLKMPQFNITSSINLADYLISLGIMENSDFGQIKYTDAQGLEGYASLTSLFQRITASVSEEGFEVAAASSESHGAPISDETEEEFIDVAVDKPFLFFVFDQASGLKLLSGAFVG